MFNYLLYQYDERTDRRYIMLSDKVKGYPKEVELKRHREETQLPVVMH